MSDVYLSRAQAGRVDQLAVDEFGMNSLVLMENAGRGCADVICRHGIAGTLHVCCGKGNNAGDGFVIARHLLLRGHKVRVWMWSEVKELSPDALANYRILERAGIAVTDGRGSQTAESSKRKGGAPPDDGLSAAIQGDDWIVDALLGTGMRGDARPPFDAVIRSINASPARRFAVDVPSGLDCDSGAAGSPTIRADVTGTFVAMKSGFRTAAAQDHLGRVEVLDIGTPPQVLRRVLRDASSSCPEGSAR